MKRLTGLILCLLLVFTLFPAAAFAEGATELQISSEADFIAAIAQINAGTEGSAFILRLTDDVTVSGSVTITGGTVTLLGGGNTLTCYHITLNGSAVLNLGLPDGSDTLTITSPNETLSALELNDQSVLNMYPGVTIGPSSAAGQAGGVQCHELSSFNMFGGTIKDCHGLYAVSGAVYLDENATFTMHNGLIENCTGWQGGAVGVSGAAPIANPVSTEYITSTFHMKGGTIKDCHDKYYGGGAVCIYTTLAGRFIMDGGLITECSGDGNGYGGAVFVYTMNDNGYVQLNQGEITSCSGTYGGGIFVYTGSTTIADGMKIYNNTASAAGDDIYSNGAKVTLGAAPSGSRLTCGDPVDGWYRDGEPRWRAHGDGTYMEKFTDTGVLFEEEYALKAAHGIIHTIYYYTDEDSWTDTAEHYTYHPENEHYTSSVPSGSTAHNPSDPSMDDFIFDGWHLDEECTLSYDFEDIVTGDLHLYPKWIPDENFVTLTYDSRGGTDIPSETYPEGTVVVPDKVPSRRGYQFTGWYLDEGCTQPAGEIIMDGDKTVYAGWRTVIIVTPASPPAALNTDDHIAYIIGFDDGLIHPERNLTRAEAASIFFRLLDEDVRAAAMTKENTFTDVQPGDWYCTAVSTMASLGILKGYPDGSFRPNGTITRAEFAAIAARFDSSSAAATAAFSDLAGHWSEPEVSRAAEKGWVAGYPDASFRPENAITRAEAVTLVNRVLDRVPETAADLLDGMLCWQDNLDTSKWYYIAIQEAANSHDYSRRQGGSEYWTGLKAAPDWAQLEK